MVKRKWLWGKRSSEKMDVENENSGSLSSHSEKYSEDQDMSRGSHSNSQSPEISSKETDNENNGEEMNERLNSLAKKLSDTPTDDGSQDSLSQEDESKVSTDTCSEISDSPKDDLSTNSLLEENVSKTKNECTEYNSSVKLLAEKLSDALLNVSLKDDLVKQHAKVAEEAVAGWEKAEKEATTLRQQLETALQQKSAVDSRANHLDVALKECVRQLRLARDEQERKITEKTNELELANDMLRKELQAQSDELEIRTIERDLSTKNAETASKQHLESIKKVAKLEAECRKLKSLSRVSSSYAESLTDSHSSPTASEAESRKINGSGDCSESWALALITELDQFKTVRSMPCNPCPPIEIDLMDDFLEMERLAALPMRDSGHRVVEKPVHEIEGKLKVQIEKMEAEKDELTTALVQTQNCLETSQFQLIESQMMCSMMKSLKEELDKERALSVASSAMCDNLENELENRKKELEIQKGSICNGELRMKEASLIETQECLEKSKGQLREAETKLRELEQQLNVSNEESNSLKFELEMKERVLIETREFLEQSKGQLSEAETKLWELENQLNASNEENKSLILHHDREREVWLANMSRREEMENELEREKQELQIQKDALCNGELEMKSALAKTRDGLEISKGQLREVEMKLGKLEREINAANEEKSSLRLQLDIVQTEVQTMSSEIESLKEQLHEERDLAAVFSTKCMELENALNRKVTSHNELKLKQEDLEAAAGKLADCQKTIASLGTQLKSLATLEDFLIDTASIPGFSPPAPLMARQSTDQPWKLHSNHTFLPEKKCVPQEGPLTRERHTMESHQHGSSSSSSSSSAYFMNPPGCDKSANGFAKYFSLSRN